MHENQNWVYIAIIGFCLSVTILYKLSQGHGVQYCPGIHHKNGLPVTLSFVDWDSS